MMLTLRLVLDTLNNYFVDNCIVESITAEATITAGRISIADIQETFPVNAYFIVDGTIFNGEVYKITASGTDYIDADNIVAEPTKTVTIKACLIPKAVTDLVDEYATKSIPTLYKSEKIGNYGYSTDLEGVKGFIINKLKPYYQGVSI